MAKSIYYVHITIPFCQQLASEPSVCASGYTILKLLSLYIYVSHCVGGIYYLQKDRLGYIHDVLVYINDPNWYTQVFKWH